jgi:hypothetical protein
MSSKAKRALTRIDNTAHDLGQLRTLPTKKNDGLEGEVCPTARTAASTGP